MGLNRKHTKKEIENLRLKAMGNKHALGYKFTEEQRLKLKGIHKGKKLPESTRTNNDPQNLISLCTSCHIKTNTNREYWKSYFNTKQYA